MGSEVRIGIDTGGTFTDVVRLEGRHREARKVPSTPDDPARAVLDGLQVVGGLPRGGNLHHGSTVGTNAVLTRTGARVVLVTTEGFEDLLHIGRGRRDDLHALRPQREAPLLGRDQCLGVRARAAADGTVLQSPSRADLDRLVRRVRELGPDAVAVCLQHAVRAPQVERQVADGLEAALWESGVSVHASASISADGREAERAATAVLDAYVAPKVVDYVGRIAQAVGESALTMMRSDGGRMAPAEVRRAPVRTLLSGPAAGVAAAHALMGRLSIPRALSFDVGGTSTDVAWLESDDVPVEGQLVVGPHRAMVPSLALETVGAGGGSLITLDAGGALRVGPASAGADPGPACYGRGGPFTLTDAWLLLDRLPDALLGGDFELDRAAAERAARPLARAASCSVRELASGAIHVAAATTARALRKASVARGHDPRGAALVAFGGAGPMLAVETAEHLELATIIVPRDPGTFAAEGTLVAPLKADAGRAVTRDTRGALDSLRRTLTKDVRKRLERQGASGIVTRPEIDARYAGQAFEVTVPYSGKWREAFHEAHAGRYGFADEARPIELVRLRVRGHGHEAARVDLRRAIPAGRGCPRDHAVSVARRTLVPGEVVVGPSRIEERTGTTWLPKGWRARAGREAELVLERNR